MRKPALISRHMLAMRALRETQGGHLCPRARLGRIPFVGSMTRSPDSSLDRFEVKRRLAHLA
jgi:hypothetical protein